MNTNFQRNGLLTLASGIAALTMLACGDDGVSDMGGSGGMTASGGQSTGGSTADGGNPAAGGETATGGLAATGGGDATGGTGGTGGTTGSGSAASGGSAGSGGMGGAGVECSTIVEVASETEELSILVDAVVKAGLADALGGEDLTVFAPTNDAFVSLLGALGAESLDDLSADQLVPILLYHVATSPVMAADAIAVAQGDGSFDTLGGTISLSLDGDSLIIDAADDVEETPDFPATVVMTDIETCNGIVHVIDGVLLPSIFDIVSTNAGFSELAGLVLEAESAASIASALDAKGSLTLFAPTNEAIGALSEVPAPAALDDILTYHVYAGGAVDAATALTFEDMAVEMLNGDSATIDGGELVTVTDTGGTTATVTTADILADNGIIHVIDGVLLPNSVTNP